MSASNNHVFWTTKREMTPQTRKVSALITQIFKDKKKLKEN